MGFDRHADISWGDPDQIFGTESLFNDYKLAKRVVLIKPESVVGRLHAGEYYMDLTSPVVYRALQLIQYDKNNLETGKVLYVIYPEMGPYTMMHISDVPIEEIEPDWPEGVEFPQGSLAAEITRKEAKTLAITIEDLWRQRGGRPEMKFDKSGGRKFKKP